MGTRSKRHVFVTIVVLITIGISILWSLRSSNSAWNHLNDILHGSDKVTISRFEVQMGYREEIREELTNRVDLTSLTQGLRMATTNDSGGGIVYGATFWFQDGSHIDTAITVTQDSKHLDVALPTFMSIKDPVWLGISLPPSLAAFFESFERERSKLK